MDEYPRGLTQYDRMLRAWILKQTDRFLPRSYPPAVLRYKVLRFLLRDVRPKARHNRLAIPEFLDWTVRVSDAVVAAGEWKPLVCSFEEPVISQRFEQEQWGDSDSDDDE